MSDDLELAAQSAMWLSASPAERRMMLMHLPEHIRRHLDVSPYALGMRPEWIDNLREVARTDPDDPRAAVWRWLTKNAPEHYPA